MLANGQFGTGDNNGFSCIAGNYQGPQPTGLPNIMLTALCSNAIFFHAEPCKALRCNGGCRPQPCSDEPTWCTSFAV
jgi:hypothetical protein